MRVGKLGQSFQCPIFALAALAVAASCGGTPVKNDRGKKLTALESISDDKIVPDEFGHPVGSTVPSIIGGSSIQGSGGNSSEGGPTPSGSEEGSNELGASLLAAPILITPGFSPWTSNDTTLIISGSCQDGAMVEISGDDVQQVECVDNAFSISVIKSLDAAYLFEISQIIESLNRSETTVLTWIRNTVLPSAPSITVPSDLVNYSNQSSFSMSGICFGTNSVTLSGVDASDVTTPSGSLTQTCLNGAFSFMIEKSSDGSYELSVTQSSANGASPAVSRTWVRDTSPPPVPTISTPSQNPLTAGGDSVVIGGACESDGKIFLSESGSTSDPVSVDCISQTYSLAVTASTDATYIYNITQVDLATNVSNAAVFTWIRNSAVASVPTITSPVASNFITNGDSVTIVGSCTSGNNVMLSGDVIAAEISDPLNATSQTCSNSQYSFIIGKSLDGAYSFNVRQSNGATTSAAAGMSWTRDTIAPNPPTITSPAANPFTSGDSTINIVGGCQYGNTVDISGAHVNSSPCTSSGTYSFSIEKSVNDSYSFHLTQTDAAGNVSGVKSFQWDRDNSIPPSPTVNITSAHSNASSLMISGTCAINHTVEIAGDVSLSDVSNPNSLSQACPMNGLFSFTVGKAADGVYAFLLSQKNASSIYSAQVSVAWTRDTVTPSVPSKIQPGESPYTSSGTLIIQGGCESQATVTLSGDDDQTAVCSSGSYQFTINKVSDGTYNFALSQTDRAGNESSTIAQQWVRNSSAPPTPTISLPTASPFSSAQSSLTINGGCQAGYLVTITGTIVASDVTTPANSLTQTCSGTNTFSFVIAKSSDATYSLSITQAIDSESPSSGSATQVWVRDTTPPVLTIGSKPSNPSLTAGATFTFTSDDASAILQCMLDGQQYASCPSPMTYASVTNGTRTFYVRGIDSVGNVGTAASYTWNQEAYSTVALYHFDSGAPMSDSSRYSGGLSNHLTNSGSTSATGLWSSEGCRFTASSSQYAYVSHNAIHNLLRVKMTLELFANFATLPSSSGAYMSLISKMGGANDYGWEFKLKRQGSNYVLTLNGSLNGTSLQQEQKSQSCTISTGTFVHLAVTWDSGAVRFFCDGVAKGTGSIGTQGSAAFHPSTAELRLGSISTGGQYLDAVLEEVRISQTVRWTGNFVPPGSAYTDVD